MYEGIIQQIDAIRELLDRGENIDYSALPLAEIMQISSSARQQIGETATDPAPSILVLLNTITRSGDTEGLGAILNLLGICLKDADRIQGLKKASEQNCSQMDFLSFCLDKVIRKMPEYQFMKNRIRLEEYYKTHKRVERHPFDGKGVVYTVVTGEYDKLRKPAVVNNEWDYIVFTDNEELSAEGWEIRLISNNEGLDATRFSRKPKILVTEYLDAYDYSVYLDGNVQITGDIKEYIHKYSTGEGFLSMNHYITGSVYEEAELCKRSGKDVSEVVDAQMLRYHKEGFPEGYGLTWNGFLIRSHRDKRLDKVMKDWWGEVLSGSRRDQLSFTYCCWKNDFVYDTSNLYSLENPYVNVAVRGL